MTAPLPALAEQLRAARKGKGWSQDRLAVESGVDQPTISKVESGKLADPGAPVLDKLGRALETTLRVLPAAAAAPPGAFAVPFAAIWIEHGHNPRTAFPAEGLAGLAESIRQSGLLQPLVVRRRDADTWWLVAGERRYRAIGRLREEGHWPDARPVPVVTVAAEAGEQIMLALVENHDREDVNPLDEGEAIERLIAHDPDHWTAETIAARLGVALRTVQSRRQLVTRLSDSAKLALRRGQINGTQARTLMAAPKFVQDDLLPSVVRGEEGYVTERDLIVRISDREAKAIAKAGGTRTASPAARTNPGNPSPAQQARHGQPDQATPAPPDWIVKATTWRDPDDRFPAEILLRRPGDDELQPAGRYVFVADDTAAATFTTEEQT